MKSEEWRKKKIKDKSEKIKDKSEEIKVKSELLLNLVDGPIFRFVHE